MPAGAGPSTSPPTALPRILDVVRQYWGFDTLRPLQEQAIRAGIEHRDSLVVMPTGGGKSLCYQVPPALVEGGRTDIVVSPLISLMKDQVDGLVANGYPAAALHSNLTNDQRRDIERNILDNKYRLLFVAPERLLTQWFLAQMERINVKAFAIDEAHCISQWGHDFRPEYRQLKTLKDRFPAASIHAYTATATPRVQDDIVAQLKLENANVLVGDFDRPNLIYRIVPKVNLEAQVLDTIRRHAREAAIVYCISRKDTEYMAEFLKANDVKAAAYHAGMEKTDRTRIQEAFAEEALDVVVATVAFGMGIDRSNVRCVIHAAMPKTVEHYQQEAGRAGRDGLEAECIMFYSGGDVVRWESLIEFSAQKIEDPDLRMTTIESQLELLSHMSRLCGNARCRHAALVNYFGQDYRKTGGCGACDFCLSEIEGMKDSTVIAQKILSCVARVEQRFGIRQVVEVLVGANTENIRKFRHEQLSTYGLLGELEPKAVQNLVYQLVDQRLLDRTDGDYPVLKLNAQSIEVLKGQRDVVLVEPPVKVKKTRMEEVSWEGVDRGLFEALRELRRSIAAERGVPAFVIFGDATLRELASIRPSSPQSLRRVRGIGEVKATDLGEIFLRTITSYCAAHGIALDQFGSAAMVKPPKVRVLNPIKDQAMRMFAEHKSLDEIAAQVGRARSTIGQYLSDWIAKNRPADVSQWVSEDNYRRVREAATGLETRAMKPVFEQLNGEVPYEEIRIVIAHIEAVGQSTTHKS